VHDPERLPNADEVSGTVTQSLAGRALVAVAIAAVAFAAAFAIARSARGDQGERPPVPKAFNPKAAAPPVVSLKTGSIPPLQQPPSASAGGGATAPAPAPVPAGPSTPTPTPTSTPPARNPPSQSPPNKNPPLPPPSR
jgi:hypothetical protein